MMLLGIQTPENVYEGLKTDEDVKAITSFNRDNKKKVYEIFIIL